MRRGYRECLGFPGYYVSRSGDVRSTWNTFCRVACPALWRRLKPGVINGKYLWLRLRTRRGASRHASVHELVLTTWGDPERRGRQIRHRDGDPRNNYIANLAWGTAKDNADDRRRHGHTVHGARCKDAKLTAPDVERIMERIRHNESPTTIAKSYDVTRSAISEIKGGRAWNRVTGLPDRRRRISRLSVSKCS